MILFDGDIFIDFSGGDIDNPDYTNTGISNISDPADPLNPPS